MPKEYEDIRDSYVKAGKPYDEAQAIAAATYNSRHPNSPVTGHKKKKGKKSEGKDSGAHEEKEPKKMEKPKAQKGQND